MKIFLRFSFNALVMGLAVGLLGCGAAGKLTKMAELPEAETKKLEEQVNDIHDALDNAKTDAAGVSDLPKDISPSDLNPAKLKKAMEDCWAEPIRVVKAEAAGAGKKAGKAAKGTAAAQAEGEKSVKKGKKVYSKFKDCTARRKENAVKMKEIAPGGKQDVVKAKVDAVDHLRKNVFFLKQSSSDIPKLLKEVVIVKGKAEAAHTATQKNPMASAKDKKENEAAYKKLDVRLDRLTKILKEDLSNLPGDLADISSKTTKAF
jgi:hypothetical protein